MNKVSRTLGTRPLLPAFLIILAGAALASAQDRFSISVGPRDMLVIQGDHKTALPLPSISQAVAVNGATFQVSYGRDANDLLTAIIAPNPSEPQDVHFTVLGKTVDSDKQAVITLSFSKAENEVRIDPGYVGVVQVNSQKLQPDSAANFPTRLATPDRTATPSEQATLTDASSDTVAATVEPGATLQPTTATPAAPATASTSTVSPTIPAPVPPTAANTPSTIVSPSEAAAAHVSVHNPDPEQVNNASQLPLTGSATPGPSTVATAGPPTNPKQHPLFWSEPITPPSGAPPSVGLNEMKLIELQGSVTVTLPGGQKEDGTDGMIVPSGSTIRTSSASSAALFMGGINSIRLLPSSEIRVTQQLDGSLRTTVVDLRDGTIFSRVGHRPGEKQNYRVATPQGVSVAKGTEFADSNTNGHHYVFVVKGVVNMLINDILTGSLTALPGNLATGAMPPANDGAQVLFSALTQLQPFQSKTQKILADIKAGTATPAELAYFDNLKNTFTVMVDDVYDPTHPNPFIGSFTSQTGFGDSIHSTLPRPQDLGFFNIPADLTAVAAPATVFSTPVMDPGAVGSGIPQ
jgi:hypothetical protein